MRANDAGGKRTVRLPGTTFIGRFLLHILPTGIKRIRHYGVLDSASKGMKLAQAQAALHMPVNNPAARESASAFMARVAKIDVVRCPCCSHGMRVVAQLPGRKHLPTPVSTSMPSNRGPP